MRTGSADAAVGMERSRLRRLARANPGVVHLGCLTGQLALYFDPPEAGVSRVAVTAVVASRPEEASGPDRFYHAVVRRVGRVGGDAGRRKVFRHPTPALEWLFEVVPDFDLLETTRVNGARRGATPD